MLTIIFLSLASVVLAQSGQGQGPPYVWDLQKPRMDAAAVAALLSQKSEGQYPTYVPIPDSNFDCSTKKQPGYYSDPQFQCQVYHRCDINGNMTSYICDNTTVFDQVTLVCDYWFNVDCSRAQEFEDFANRRLYQQELPLFDTPPADYVAPQATSSNNAGGQQQQSSGNRNRIQTQSSNTRSGTSQNQQGGRQVAAKASANRQGASSRSAASGRGAQAGGQARMSSFNNNGQNQQNAGAQAQGRNMDESAQDQAGYDQTNQDQNQ